MRPLRVHGTLTLDLEGGKTGTVEIDIDLSDPKTSFDIENVYDDRELGRYSMFAGATPLATVYSLRLPVSLRSEPLFVIRTPREES